MGYSTGGIIFKNGGHLTDEGILTTLKRESFGYTDDISFENATSSSLSGIAIGRIGDNVMVFGRDIPHSCSFEGNALSKLDERLESVSNDGDIICFLMNSVSNVYAWSIFRRGKREHTVSAVAGKTIAEIGRDTDYDEGLKANENDLMKLLENFTGHSFVDMISAGDFSFKAYYR